MIRNLTISLFPDLFNYVQENVSCLLYIVDVWPYQAIYFTSYASLLKDISEAYGSWFALAFVILSVLSILISVQQVIENHFNIGSQKDNTINPNVLVNHTFFSTYINNNVFHQNKK